MTVEIVRYPKEEDWLLVKQCALVTVGKESEVPPTEEFKKKILRARHSPIRELKFVFMIRDLPSYVSVHLCRHVHAQPYVKTQRNDRQKAYDRRKAPQDAPVNMMWSINGEELITVANKRLCMLASEETREVVKLICEKAAEVCPEIASELVPMCKRNGGVCHEMFPCGRKNESGGSIVIF